MLGRFFRFSSAEPPVRIELFLATPATCRNHRLPAQGQDSFSLSPDAVWADDKADELARTNGGLLMNPPRVTKLAAAAVLASAVGLTSPGPGVANAGGYCTESQNEELNPFAGGICPQVCGKTPIPTGTQSRHVPMGQTNPHPAQGQGMQTSRQTPDRLTNRQPPHPPATPPPRRPIQDPVTHAPAPPPVTAPIEAPAPVLRTPVLPGRPNQ